MTTFLLGVIAILMLSAVNLLSSIMKQQAAIIHALTQAAQAILVNQQAMRIVGNQLIRFSTTMTSFASQQQPTERAN